MKVKVTAETRSLIDCKNKFDSLFDDVFSALANIYGDSQAEEDELLDALNQVNALLSDRITEVISKNIGDSTEIELVI